MRTNTHKKSMLCIPHLALVHVLVAFVEVRLDAVPVVDLDVVADLGHRRADGLE